MAFTPNSKITEEITQISDDRLVKALGAIDEINDKLTILIAHFEYLNESIILKEETKE